MQTNIQDSLSIKQRLNAPMPKFFRIIRNGGIILAAVAGALMGTQRLIGQLHTLIAKPVKKMPLVLPKIGRNGAETTRKGIKKPDTNSIRQPQIIINFGRERGNRTLVNNDLD